MYGPIRRNQQVSATGPQSYGASEAYVEKYFLRNLFKIPTGELDADAEPQEGLPPKRTPPKPPKSEITHIVETADIEWSRTKRDALIKIMEMAQDPIELERWGVDHKDEIRKLLPDDKDMVTAAYVDHKRTISGVL
jgi:hypothetical protein